LSKTFCTIKYLRKAGKSDKGDLNMYFSPHGKFLIFYVSATNALFCFPDFGKVSIHSKVEFNYFSFHKGSFTKDVRTRGGGGVWPMRTLVDVGRGGLCRCGRPILNHHSSLKSFS